MLQASAQLFRLRGHAAVVHLRYDADRAMEAVAPVAAAALVVLQPGEVVLDAGTDTAVLCVVGLLAR